MAGYTHSPFSWNGVSLAAYKVYWDEGDPSPYTEANPVDAISATRPNKGAQYIRFQKKPANVLLTVEIADTNETTISTLYNIFNPEDGLVYLRDDDGDAKRWRIEAQAQSAPVRVETVVFKIPIYLPDTIWEEDTAPSPVTNSNNTISLFTQALTVVGNRDTDDVQVTISPDNPKTKGYDDWAYSIPGFFVNRCGELNRKSVYLGDQSGVAGRFATNAASGASVARTGASTSITVDITAGASTITVASTAAFSATGGLGYLNDSRGNGFHDQFSYTGFAGLVLQGVQWLPASAAGREPGGTVITAGGIAHTQAQEVNTWASGMMLSADDLAVYLDGKRIDDKEVYPVAWYGAASDVVAVVTMPKRLAKTVTTAMTASVPANGGELAFLEGVDDLAEQGMFAVGDELFAWTARDVANRKLTNIKRAMHLTTAAVHAINATADFSLKTFVVCVGKATAPVTARPLASRPAHQLPASNNQARRWGLVSDDASTAFFDRAYPDRPESWAPGFDPDGNTAAPRMTIFQSTSVLRFKDDDPGDGSPPYNFADMELPWGVDAGSTAAYEMDWVPAYGVLNLELFARDAQGVWKLIDELQQATGATNRTLASSAGAPSGFAVNMYGVRLKARANVVTGVWSADDETLGTINNATNPGIPPYIAGDHAISFTLTARTRVRKILIRLKTSAAVAQSVNGFITTDSSGAPSTVANDIVRSSISVSLTGLTTATTYEIAIAPGVIEAPGTYWLVLQRTNVGGGDPNVLILGDLFSGYTQHSKTFAHSGAAWARVAAAGASFIQVLAAYDDEDNSRIEADQPLIDLETNARTKTTADFDNVEIILEPSQSVYSHRVSAFAQSLYHYSELMQRTTPNFGGSITLDRWGTIPSQVTLDFRAREYLYTENSYTVPMNVKYGSILAANANDPPIFPPGADVLQFTIPDVSQADYTTAYRGRKSG